MCKVELFPDTWLFWDCVWKSQVDLHFASAVVAEDGTMLVVCNCCIALIHTALPAEGVCTAHLMRQSDFDLPAKVSEVALPVVGYEASEVSPELWGSAFCLGMQGQQYFQSAELDLGNIICLWPWRTIWMHGQTEGGLLCAPPENNCWKYLDLYEHSQPIPPFLERLWI